MARFDDASSVKKAKFLKCYQQASQEGLNTRNIKAGWKAAGLHPWCPRKVIHSNLVLPTTQGEIITPQTPHSRKRKHSVDDVYHTPRNRRDYSASVQQILSEESISRPVRSFLYKTGKALDQIEWDSLQKDVKIATQDTQIEQLLSKKKKKKAIDYNETFANIEKIKATKDALAAKEAAKQAAKQAPKRKKKAKAKAKDD